MSRALRTAFATLLVCTLAFYAADAASMRRVRAGNDGAAERLRAPGPFWHDQEFARPADVTLFTVSRDSARVRLDWVLPADPTVAGVLVFGSLQPVAERPVDGRRYRPLTVQGRSVVICVTARGESGCTVDIPPTGLPVDGWTFYFSAFTFDGRYIYSEGAPALSLPLAGTSSRWTYTTAATSMQPAGVLPDKYALATGNDRLLHRVHTATGLRTGWTPIVLPAEITSRPLAGDLDLMDDTVYASAANGVLYRFALDDGTSSWEASAAAVAHAGCAAGTLSGGPVAVLDAYDLNGVDADDAVIVATRCGPADNKLMSYPLMLGTAVGSYAGGAGGLGAALANPRILYRNDGRNLVYAGVRDDGGESLAVVEVEAGGGLTFYAQVTGIGDVETIPFTFRRTVTSAFVLAGTTSGMIHLFDALARSGDQLVSRGSITLADGPVRGVAASTRIPVAGGFENWVVWSTNNSVHGVKVRADGTFDLATRWDRNYAGPSSPLVLRNVYAAGDTLAFFGTQNGRLHSIDATTGASIADWTISPGKRVTEPTFDFGDGFAQGLAVTSDAGGLYWIPLTAPLGASGAMATEEAKPPIEIER